MIFHLAIPSRNLNESKEFYVHLGAKVGREYKTHIVLELFGVQLVCHLSDESPYTAKMYPRHFGVICESEKELMYLWFRFKNEDFVFEEHFVRHHEEREEHQAFFLQDPSNNVIEFKWYKNQEAVFE
jgi:extradiol dioxygenase family protein